MKNCTNADTKRFDYRKFAVLSLTLVCILVLVIFFTAQVAHHHNEAAPDDHCPLCLAAHWAIPAVATLALVGFFYFSTTYTAELLSPVSRFWFHALYNRPPPSCQVLA
jgi:small-conductance mechanosensitive channel